ncbi:hypothetical protein ACTNRH_000013 [Vibrio vulnificus]|nr:hypothetical protein [Vibrio vulnificus]EIF5019333.1 hypothetical protein [Vibrio vulnificus]EIO2323973.1 hypothetical protein [Vibrio vulnificus]EIO4069101.1 hypothetical protein [Vibrio vulnificus]ELH0902045.1 hypothetical protein [Vibrio vulnificus]ELV8669797.1 hypothetical protein [Vibrio vulnificus]
MKIHLILFALTVTLTAINNKSVKMAVSNITLLAAIFCKSRYAWLTLSFS